MRKIIYSSILKLIAVILCITSIVSGVLIVTEGILEYDKEKTDIYSFESDFSESWYMSYLLGIPEEIVYSVYNQTFGRYESDGDTAPVEVDTDRAGTTAEEVTEEEGASVELETARGTADVEMDMPEAREAFSSNLEGRLSDFYDSEKIHYFVQWNDRVFTNCEAETPEELMQGEFYSYVKRDETGRVARSSSIDTCTYWMEDLSHINDGSTVIISCSVKEEVVTEYKAIWERQEGVVIHAFVRTLICAVVALLLLIYLLCVCGKTAEGEYKNMWIDRIWLEVHVTAMAGAGIGAVALCIFVLEEYVSGHFPYKLIGLAMGTVSALGCLVIITSLLSIIRNIKTRTLMESSVIFQVVRWVLRMIVKMIKWVCGKIKTLWRAIVRLFSKKTGIIFITMLLIYTALIGALGIGTASSAIWLVLGILLFVFACFVVAYRAGDLDEIKKGIGEVRGGNVAYKIPDLKCDDMKTLAVNINDIAKGLDESVSAKVKAERMKTELITNVSHDLKTPITSIISYAELLSQMEDLPEEARDYVSIIARKGDRLKRLTQDLFDISKVQSGNDDVVLEKLDVALLISQALGEHDHEIQGSGLPFCVDVPKELYISADGRKMSRVLSNLIHNILKYAMKNTRVFITAVEKDGDIEIVFKNISAYPLDFDVEEITHRFVRGDESRTTEGNGLGLAIAKSYTEICNGSFEVVADGDMFKAILRFKRLYS